MKVDLQAAERYLTILDNEAGFFTWQTFDDAAKGRKNLTGIIQGSLDNLSEQLIKLNAKGAGIYISINATDGIGRKIENVTRIRAVFADLDGAPLEGIYQCSLEPHLITESSPGKFHAYWLVDGLPLEQFKPIQQVIAARFESDPSVCDLPRVLRVPGFIHRKGEPHQVRIVAESGAVPYTLDDICTEFPPQDAKKTNNGAAPETEAHGFQAHLAKIGHHEGGDGFHWPITRAIAAYVTQYGNAAPVEPLKAMVRSTVDRADRSQYTDAQLTNIKSNVYLDRAIHGALGRFGEAKENVTTVEDIAEKVEAAGGGTVVHLRERRQDREEQTHPQAWHDELSRTDKGALHCSVANIIRILQNDPAWAGALGWDEFSLKVMKLKPPPFTLGKIGEWVDSDDTKTVVWLSDNYQLRAQVNRVAECINVVAEPNTYHPIREYLSRLEWDGQSRVKTWLSSYMGSKDTPYSRLVGGCWMIGAIARVMRPGCKMDNVIIFEGGQGKGKSRALNILAGEWFTDTPFELGSKDGYITMRGKWIIELAELDTFNRAESTKAKHFFAASFDTYRDVYGRRALDVLRQCIFAGTTNSDEYLKDDSGNRRYWPIKTGVIRHNQLGRDRDQLWAEALHLFSSGEPWWFDHGIDYVAKEQDKRFVTDAWEDRVSEYIAGMKRQWIPSSETPFYVTVASVLSECLQIPPGKWTRQDQMRASSVLKRLGMIRKRIMIDGRRGWGYAHRFDDG